MIQTPSLRSRVTRLTIVVVVVLVLALDLFVYLSLRDRLDDTLSEVLDARVALVGRLAREVPDGEALVAELDDLGVPVRLTPPGDASAPPDDVAPRSERRVVTLPDGTVLEVFVSRVGADSTLRRVLVVELLGSGIVVLLALVLVNRAATVVTRPLEHMVDAARDIAAGDLDRRLAPSDPDTELGRMAAAFDQMVDALEAAVTDARQAETRSRRFLADAAHQLRTPLAGLRASAETLLAHPDGPDRDQLAANLARESARLTRLVSSLLRVARLDRGEPPTRRATDLEQLVADELDRQRDLAPALQLTLATTGPVPIVSCDPDAIREALANLLDNARRFAVRSVRVTLRPAVGAVVVEVCDDGPGVPDDLRDRVFDRFQSSDGGSGLGLAIARGVLHAHGGDLRLVDDAFLMTVPVAGLGA
jgi:two-component system OmpR family sensor kinase